MDSIDLSRSPAPVDLLPRLLLLNHVATNTRVRFRRFGHETYLD